MSVLVPTKVTLLAYHVGFGDCFLVRFHYPDRCRHVLIDFGTTSRPAKAPENQMERIANSICQECEGKLDALVATHRHSDHISGFATDDGPGSIIAACKPDLVVQSWTEDPNAAPKATGPTAAFLGGMPGLGGKELQSGRGFVGRLDDACRFAEDVRNQAREEQHRGSLRSQNELMFLGEVGLKNASAVQNLVKMGSNRPYAPRYVYCGADSGFDDSLLPGVKVSVLGPPTLDQSQTIRSQADENPDEFWMLAQAAPDARVAAETGGPFGAAAQVPAYARWLKEGLDSLGARELVAFVRQLDGVLNNTSVILLFEVGPVKLLFPGDAQIENWSYALQQPGVKEVLEDVSLYKVGHHGSRNATPKTLWQGFKRRSPLEGDPNRLMTVLSTKGGKHGSPADNTEVPRVPLVTALKAESRLVSTEEPGGGLFSQVEVECG
jgi:hypothetical protein